MSGQSAQTQLSSFAILSSSILAFFESSLGLNGGGGGCSTLTRFAGVGPSSSRSASGGCRLRPERLTLGEGIPPRSASASFLTTDSASAASRIQTSTSMLTLWGGSDQNWDPAKDLGSAPVADAVARLGELAEREPALGGKVDALGGVETEVKARVVALRVGEDELARELHDAVEGDARVGEHARRGEERLVPEELRALGPVRREEACLISLGCFEDV